MALGQLLDYSRYTRTDEHPEPPRRAAVPPALPDEDLQDLLAEHEIVIVRPLNADFIGGPPSIS